MKRKITVDDILAKSSRATCGITEREVLVPTKKVPWVTNKLKSAGFHVIGTGHGNRPMKKVWFIRSGNL